MGGGRVGDGYGDIVCKGSLVVNGSGEVIGNAPEIVDKEADVVCAWREGYSSVVDR